MTDAHRRRAVLAAIAVGCALRLAFAFGYWVDKPLTHDEREYLHLAGNLAAGRGFDSEVPVPSADDPERFGRAPLYPLFLAGVGGREGGDARLDRIRLAQVLTGCLTICLLASLAGRAAGDGAIAPAAWLAALYPPFVWLPAYVLSETLYSFLALAGVLWLARALDRPLAEVRAAPRRAGPLVAAGLLAGAAALTRPAHLLFIVLVGAWLLWARRPDWAVLVAIGAVVVVGPWTARNYLTYNRLVLIAAQGGVNFWIGNHPLSRGEGDMAANPAIKRDNLRLRTEHQGRSPEQLEPVYYREAFRTIAADPVWWCRLLARKLFYLWMPIGPSYTLHSPRYLLVSLASYGLLMPVGLAGLAALWWRGRSPRTLGLLAGSAVLTCVAFLPQERFRIPAIDPALLVGAAAVAAVRRLPDRRPAC